MSARRELHLGRLNRFLPPLGREFVSIEVLSGWVLVLAAVSALVWVNLDSDSYHSTWTQTLSVGPADHSLTLDLRHWITDGLMAIFFFVVGLEIKRELVEGELSDRSAAVVPAVAALGGMIVPAGLFVLLNAGGEGARGWAIPMATDIAFAIGVLAVLGSRVAPGAKVFLLTLAIVDDIGAILVIAIFYSKGVEGTWLLGAAGVVAVVLVLRRLGAPPLAYAVPGVALWLCVHESGVHATIAGVVLGLLMPVAKGATHGTLERMEDALHPWSSFLVVPLFALANSGVVLDGSTVDAMTSSALAGGIVLGLVVGKPLGIVGATALVLRTRRARLPTGMRMADVVGAGLVAGMGFTVSLFIANLSFGGTRLEVAKLSVLAASLAAGVLGAAVVMAVHAKRRRLVATDA